MRIEPTGLDGVFLVQPRVFTDERGTFAETYSRRAFEAAGLHADFVQQNHSHSLKAGTVRGLHFQRPPHAQAKLVRCVRGAILDVAVDLRRGSPTYGRHLAVELSGANGLQLFIPHGFAHGFSTLADGCDVTYQVDGAYSPAHEGGLRFDDPGLGVDWRLPGGAAALLSPKDRVLPGWAGFESPFVFADSGVSSHA